VGIGRRLVGITRKLAWVLLAFVVLASISVYVLARTDWGRARLVPVLESGASRFIDGELHIARLEGSLFRGAILHGVSIVRDGRTVLTIERVEGQYSLRNLLSSAILLDDIVLYSPRFTVTEYPDEWRAEGIRIPKGDPTQPSDGTVTLRRVEIVDGTIAVRPVGQAYDLADVQAELSVSVTNEINVGVERFSATETLGGLVVTSLTTHVRFTDDRIALDPLEFSTPTSRVQGTLAMRDGGILESDLKSDSVRIAELVHYAPVFAGINISPAIDIRLVGPLDALRITGPIDDPVAGGATVDAVLNTTGVFSARGKATLRRLDIAPLALRPDLPTRLTGDVQFDLRNDEADRGITGTFTSTLMRSSYAEYNIDHLWTKGALTLQGVTSAFDASIYGATSVGDLSYDFDTAVTTVKGRLRGGNAARLPAFLELPALISDVNGTYTLVANTPKVWRLESVLDASTLEGATIAPGMVANISLNNEDVSYAITGTMTDVDPKRMTPKLMDEPVDMPFESIRISGVIDVEGGGAVAAPLTDHNATFSGTLDADVDGASLRAASLSGVLASRRLTMTAEGAAAGTWDRLAQMDGAGIQPTGTFKFAVTAPDVTAAFSPTFADGDLAVSLDASRIYGIDLTSATIAATAKGGVITFARSRANGPLGRLDLDGTLGMADGSESNLRYVVDIADLSLLPKDLEIVATGQLRTEGRLTGPFSTPVARGTAVVSTLAAYGISVLNADGTYEVRLPEFLAERMTGTADLKATFLEAGGQQWPRASVKAAFDADSADITATLEHARATIDLAGTVSLLPEEVVEVLATALMLKLPGEEWKMLDGARSLLRVDPLRLTMDRLELANGDERLVLAGGLSFTAPGDPTRDQLKVDATSVSVAPFVTTFLGEERVTGTLNGTVVVTGVLDDPLVKGTFAVTNGTADKVPFTSVGGTVAMSAGMTTVDISLDAGTSGTASIKGNVPVDPKAAGLNATIVAALTDVGVVAPAIGYISNASGTANGTLHVTGSIEVPEVNGDMALTSVRFEVPETGVGYRNMNATLRVAKSILIVERFTMEDEDGSILRVNGRLDVLTRDRAGDLDLRIVAKQFKLLGNQFGDLSVSLDLTGAGTVTAPQLIGAITIERGRFEVDQLLQQFLPSTAYVSAAPVTPPPPVDPHAAPVPPSVFSGAAMSIDVILPDNVIVRGRGLRTDDGPIGLGDINLTLGGILHVVKARGGEASLKGEVNVVRGTYDFQGRRFDVERGSRLNFRNDDYTNPTLDITATREVSGVEVRAHIQGTAMSPSLTLQSDPSLDEGDILALVVFNRPINQLGGGERVSLAARAGSLAAGALAGPIADSVARALDLDVFEIQTAEAGTVGATVTVGRQVSDRLFVGFKHEFGGQGINRLTFEYRLSEFLRIVTSFAPGGQPANRTARTETAGIDLIFVIRR
jgi:hypothetical protein